MRFAQIEAQSYPFHKKKEPMRVPFFQFLLNFAFIAGQGEAEIRQAVQILQI